MLNYIKKQIQASIDTKQNILNDTKLMETIAEVGKACVALYRNGKKTLLAGNGGSAADAQHLAAEFVSKLAKERAPLPAEALTVDTSILTAIGNDYGYDQIFSRQISGKMTSKDIFLGITTSGQSQNILNALEKCKEMSIPSIIFTGHDGGLAKEKADYCIIAAGSMTSTIQELHIVLAHSLCESVERAIFQN